MFHWAERLGESAAKAGVKKQSSSKPAGLLHESNLPIALNFIILLMRIPGVCLQK
jgi:hypothetical protein